MSSVGECTVELLVFPIIFQTVSFHHRASYEVRFSFSLPVARLHPVRQFSAGDQQQLIDRNGNAWNVGGHAQTRKHFRTNKFPIEYNDQIVKFKTGCIARLSSKQQQTVRIHVELMRLDQEKAKCKGNGKRVSSEILEVSLRGGEGENLRRIVFSTNEYISFLDVAFQFTRLRGPFCFQEFMETRQLYQRQVIERLQIYRELAQKTAHKLEQFELTKLNHPSFRHNYYISATFQAQFIERQIADLNYIAVRLPQEKPDENIDSHFSIQKYDSIDTCVQIGGVNNILCDFYQCEPVQLQNFIKSTGKLIQLNIRSLFERLVQLTICLLGQDQHFIVGKEINRIKAFIAESQRNRALQSPERRKFSQELINAHKIKMSVFLNSLSNITGCEIKNPYVQVSNEPQQKEVRRGSMDNTLTVFIHGYKGNQYDLSKIKSHLMMFLGCNHFYSIKGLNNDKASQSTIRELGQNAARELMTFLALSPTFKSINFIGFSLGGVIVRAMLPWLQPHKSRLNLFVTIATPHLGIREIQNCLVRAGLCYMRRVAGIQSIRELNSERDASSCRYLLELASGEGLQWFKNIILVGSFQDSYVPAYSALVQYTGEDEVTSEMARRLEKVMSRAVRVTAKLQYKQSILDTITRRKTHICFLEDDSFIKYLLVRLHHLFAHEGHD